MATYPCQLCGKTFLTLEKFTIHSYSHSRERPYKCLQPDCGKAFISRYKLMRHMATHSPQKSHQCAYCEKTFNRKDHLKNHLQTHDPNKMAFGCEECGKKYNTMLGYKRHLALHAASSGDLTCGVCALELGSTEVLLDHLKAHAEEKPSTGTKEKKHQCDHCERCFYTRKDVRRHLVVHTGCKDFLCQFCAQRFGRKDHLTRHTKKTHPQELMKESLQAGDLLNTLHTLAPQFQLKAAPLSPFPIGAPAQNGLAGSLPAEVHTLNALEQPTQPIPVLSELLASLHPMATPSSPPAPFQNHKYNTGSTSYPPLAGLPLKTDTKGFCSANLLEDLPLQEPQSPHKLNAGFDLAKGGAGKVNLPKELAADAVNLLPASLDLSPLLGFWQLPPPATQNAFGSSGLALGAGESLPHRLGCLGQQPQDPSLAMSTMSLGQLPLPPIPHVFPAGTGSAILPHFHHAFR
ncbi:zinc finger protein PLAGL1 isoform X1 [Moschus berezovskii]|uniref:zinc finger protein PLAGL1 isoform X1 n=2 Tax=Moschus berezovskii TaxID=68408 RepID=UPI002443BB58|nr:zinc finger protein PLAGL1 isoform X1 [Moschus berezovskii]XP_055288887.1 zinc finger protein PLAGL1 isoform X1 [Moschus berezovskii]XP_055288888.1 zinc finger protein PLAGL1 isoform X1 [Moschus berezovskii]XP_055288889.1 zinc finger protein PLAGL1 isoform X1 [Moschus berezovskii]XP_055288890.1 zinc finger protein PLAGL1 isoform X1 [Moschus berezovskii]XP_055288891.1 zinc finger protein PLAGL1 isoform X1 [Moschus berezovskii]XP_055288892.1 zinc finger protein PLAGL1 isoform X1 [Moschus ber